MQATRGSNWQGFFVVIGGYHRRMSKEKRREKKDQKTFEMKFANTLLLSIWSPNFLLASSSKFTCTMQLLLNK